MASPDPELADGLVSIGEEAVARSNDASFYQYFTDQTSTHELSM
jgi:hypothetical protein